MFQKFFPYALMVCLLALSVANVAAQTDSLTRKTSIVTPKGGTPRLEMDPVIISVAKVPGEKLSPLSASRMAPQLNQMLTAAIDMRMGSPYVYGSSGPYSFDCSGFVWSVFQSAGIRFDRESARSLWTRFAPATKDEEQQFGTLVFFSGLTHVGIVADRNGFYHASRSQGVIYSPFNKYWASRVDGFRRVPLPIQFQAKSE